jgi:hypothetical protein
MSADSEPKETVRAKTENSADLTKGINLFARYTSPVMLAVLASADGNKAALAQTVR